jgi:tRNA A37 threonylcarbamoyladenosine dehydratase
MTGSRYSRNEALFGREGQQKIAQTNVAIVGIGGLGSHVVQQLAYLGVTGYGVISTLTSSPNRA